MKAGAAGVAVRAAAGVALLTAVALMPPWHPAWADSGPALQIEMKARGLQDSADDAGALALWRTLRGRVPPDADLELVIALDEARTGNLDSAAVHLAGGVLTAAAGDSLRPYHFHVYPAEREGMYMNGTFEGWFWYVWRARAEVAVARGYWPQAVEAARRCVAARPMSGTEWLLLAVCAGQTDRVDEARAAASRAVALDAGLPEAQYLDGLWAWRDGRRGDAQARFHAAMGLDSAFRQPAVAMMRSQLPGAPPDSLPTAFLTGRRAVGMLTSPVGPKVEDAVAVDHPAIIGHKVDPVVPDSLKARLAGQPFPIRVFVDEKGRVVLADMPWYAPGRAPTFLMAALLAKLPEWRFIPARVLDEPRAVWTELNYSFQF